jgi:hypothetical protein
MCFHAVARELVEKAAERSEKTSEANTSIKAARWINSEDKPLIPLKRSREGRRWAAELLNCCACNRFEDSKRFNYYDWIATMQYFYPQNQLKAAICEHANIGKSRGGRVAWLHCLRR